MNKKLRFLPVLLLILWANSLTAQPGSRWYSHFGTLDTFQLNQALTHNLHVIPLWFDSTVRNRIGNGLQPIRFSALSQHFDPVNAPQFNAAQLYPGQIYVTNNDAFQIDSLWVEAIYNRVKPAVNDTLIISVSISGGYWQCDTNTLSIIPINGPAPTGPVPGAWPMYAPLDVDVLNRAAFSPNNGPRRIWKVVLSNADSSSTGKRYYFRLPSPLNFTAGQKANVTYSFKSGDTWVVNVDSLQQHNHWMPFASYEGAGNAGPLQTTYLNNADHNMSGLLPAATPTQFYPTPYYGLTGPFSYIYHSTGIHINNCPTCPVLFQASQQVEENGLVTVDAAYPNPANDMITIRLTAPAPKRVKVSLTDATGRNVLQQLTIVNIHGKLRISLGHLPEGLYQYQLAVGKDYQTGRILIQR